MAVSFSGKILKPNDEDNLDLIEGAIVVGDSGEVLYLGSVDGISKTVKAQIGRTVADVIILPGNVNSHCHTFQPPAIAGGLMDADGQPGWLSQTLNFEAEVKANPEWAREIARRKFERHIRNGIVGGLEYTTSSVAAAEIVLEVAKEMGLEKTVKVGYVAMDQNVPDGLKETPEAALEATESLLRKYGKRVVVIDRFPIACSSELRKGLVALAKKYKVLYETHMDESVGEQEFTASEELYHGKSIVDVLIEDGVFDVGMKVGLAHAIHTSPENIARIKEKIKGGCKVYIRACPDSNGQLQSHIGENGNYVKFPLDAWLKAGAIVTLGLDKGAGRGVNMFAEALSERGRLHDGGQPTYLDLVRFATVNGMRSLGIDAGMIVGAKPNIVVVRPAGLRGLVSVDNFRSMTAEQVAGAAIEGGVDPHNIVAVYADGVNLTESAALEASRRR